MASDAEGVAPWGPLTSSPSSGRARASQISSLGRPLSGPARSSSSAAAKASGDALRQATGRLRAQAWRTAAVSAKQRQLDILREQDQARIRQRAERNRDQREERFQQLSCSLSAPGNIGEEMAFKLREVEASDDQRRRTVHGKWHAAVGGPLEAQLFEHFNGPARADRQLADGCKHVGFVEPGQETFRLRTVPSKDPLKREFVDQQWEDEFDQEARRVLGAPAGGPALLRSTWAPGAVPKARARPMLHATEWSQVRIQGQPGVAFQQAFERGPGSLMGRTWGSAPSESDAVPAAGKRTVRCGAAVRHNDLGVLGGGGSWAAARGEASMHKTWHGASSGAPAQDHYTYAVGAAITSSEFPQGKRTFAVRR